MWIQINIEKTSKIHFCQKRTKIEKSVDLFFSPKVAKDNQAKIGCNGGSKYCYGYKKHQSVDMQSGLINKVALSAANVTDNKGFKDLCPNDGAVYADKGYCLEDSQKAAKIKKCTFGSDKKE